MTLYTRLCLCVYRAVYLLFTVVLGVCVVLVQVLLMLLMPHRTGAESDTARTRDVAASQTCVCIVSVCVCVCACVVCVFFLG